MGSGDLDGQGKTDIFIGGWGAQARLLLTDKQGNQEGLPGQQRLAPARSKDRN
ncbi:MULTISPECIES: hypothetical protein [Pseudomonas]|uniref:hypothetical protein n=1 Tax=Pseudomonas TaxID=286 RepID=UPI000B2CEF1D|nr:MULTISPECIES: hypothetical protein [Pseudomonas]